MEIRDAAREDILMAVLDAKPPSRAEDLKP
ncbi:hypothetical protein AciM339_1021 [Aciduliprofundum sp. MAR08-339]|nr:hypothetical protein AciM339_1021 [Aciduliprofundum sp. MAR08-339]